MKDVIKEMHNMHHNKLMSYINFISTWLARSVQKIPGLIFLCTNLALSNKNL